MERTADDLQKAVDAVRSCAEKHKLAHLRATRDAKIAEEKAVDAKLNEHGGFSRGRHKLTAEPLDT